MSEDSLDRSESTNPKLQVGKKTVEVGQPNNVMTIGNFVRDQRKAELQMPNFLCTVDTMCGDDAVYTAIDITNMLVLNSLYKGSFVSKTQKGKIAADYLNYCIRNMSSGTWMQAANNMATDIKYGFSLLNLVTEKRKYGKYKGNYVIKKLAPRSQSSLYSWVWDNDFREVVGIVQKPMVKKSRTYGDFKDRISIGQINQGRFQTTDYPFISSDNLLHCIYNPTNNNPQGDSPLLHCYAAWKEKSIVEQYEVIGVTKDMGGALVIRVPSDLIERAGDPAQYPNEAAEYDQLQTDAANLHAGKSTYIVLSSDVDPASKTKDFDIEFKGVDGGGKQYSTSAIIEQKRKSIYNVFGAGFLLLGQDGSGSFSLSTNQMSVHDQYAQRSTLWKVDVINTQLAPRLLALNNIELDWEDMPQFEAADPTPANIEVISKAIQRLKSTGALTPEALREYYRQLDLPTEGIDELTFDDGDTSRGGENNGGTAGTKGSQAEGAASDLNNDNAS